MGFICASSTNGTNSDAILFFSVSWKISAFTVVYISAIVSGLTLTLGKNFHSRPQDRQSEGSKCRIFITILLGKFEGKETTTI